MKHFFWGSAPILLWPLISLAQSAPSLTPESLRAALKAKPTGTQAEQLAEQIRQYFGGKENLQKGPAPKVEGLLAAWAIEVNGGNARSSGGFRRRPQGREAHAGWFHWRLCCSGCLPRPDRAALSL